MSFADLVSMMLCLCGGFFFLAGTVGMIRFPDSTSRLHALTKADNLGLGCIVLGLMARAPVPSTMLKLVIIWLSVLVASSTACFLVGNHVLKTGSSSDASMRATRHADAPGKDGAP